MRFHWLGLVILWSIYITIVLLQEFSLMNPSGLPVEALYYLAADTKLDHIEPSEELRRSHRSFFKKLWKHSGLGSLFGHEGCVNCCNTNYNNADAGDTFEPPLTPPYNPYSQQLPPLPPLHPFHRILQPFLRPTDLNPSGPHSINNYDGSNTPSGYEEKNVNECSNSNDCCNSNPQIREGSCHKNVNENIPEVNGDNYGENIYNNESECKSDTPYITNENEHENCANKENNCDIDYGNNKASHEELCQNVNSLSGEVVPPCTALDGGVKAGTVTIYQPIILVLPMYQPSPAAYSISSKSEAHFNGPPPAPIILSETDQPYRSCPELFSDYTNHINHNRNHALGNTFINAQYISC